ncbi:MAG: acyltransferase [Lunatimonas sp.]|uniref:acyltransferase family protein n=1 Tax=Lunatimonas sp. TaxID=2060141 RepID=UPI00263A8280|nr:acyltransferase [Lunatimonas sp.]MCC5939166.1 acyltransferase [Lunatimonas sp.]
MKSNLYTGFFLGKDMERLIKQDLRLNNFDIIRFLLASSVILCHSYVILYGYEQFVVLEPFMKWSSGQISIGSFAVNFFFVISGFLILKSYESSSGLGDYFSKRVLRIYPGFIMVFLLGLFLFGPVGYANELGVGSYFEFLDRVPKKREFVNMLSLQPPKESSYFTNLPQRGLNNSLWTIQYEFVCYLLVPLLGFIGVLKSRRWTLVSLVVVYACYLAQSFGFAFTSYGWPDLWVISNPYFYFRFFTYFLLGAVVYLYRENIPSNTWFALISVLGIIVSFRYSLVDQLLPVFGTYLLFYLAYMPKLQYPAFSKHGDFSYGIYLYGWPLQQLIMTFFSSYLTPFWFFTITFPIVLIFAIFSWYAIERPFLRLKMYKPKAVFDVPAVEVIRK